jgi:site-specific DNA-methyltransferase (adenine-specific)
MGREFDRQHRGGEGSEAERALAWNLRWLRDLYRVLVPGSHAVVFQGARTYHRLAYAAELAGFAVQPMLCGITGQAMAQGGAVRRLIDREAGAAREVVGSKLGRPGYSATECTGKIRPTGHAGGFDSYLNLTAPSTPLAADFEGWHSRTRDQLMPIALLLKPPNGSLACNASRWGVAGLWADGCRVETSDKLGGGGSPSMRGVGVDRPWHNDPAAVLAAKGRRQASSSSRGRFPGNVLLDDAAADEVGRQSGVTANGGQNATSVRDHGNLYGARTPGSPTGFAGDTGTAARYFPRFRYVGRAPKSERMRGLETWHWTGDLQHPEGWRRVSVEEWQKIPRRRQMVGSNHPTLKPLELVRWVARLALPPPGPEATAIRERTTGSRGRVLVPFSGVLSEAIGCAVAGWPEVVAIEVSASYVAQGACRWRAWGPYSEARAAAVEAAGGLSREEHHEGQGELFACVRADVRGSLPW